MSSENVMQEDAFNLLISMSKDIERECKELFDLAVEQTQATEDDIFPAYKLVSLKAHKMLVLLKTMHEKAKPGLKVQQQMLRDCASGFGRGMYVFVQARRDLFLNPFDYLSQQELGNALKSLLKSNKEMVSALDVYKLSLEEEDSDSSEEVTTNGKEYHGRPLSSTSSPVVSSQIHVTPRPVLVSSTSSFFNQNSKQETRSRPINVISDKENVTTAAKYVEDAVLQRDTEKFYKAVKEFVEAVTRLFDLIKILSLDIPDDKLRQCALFLVNSGRAVLNSTENDDVPITTFDEAMKNLDLAVQAFVFACSKTPAGRQSIRQSVKVNSSSSYVPPSPLSSPVHTYSSQAERTYPPSLRSEIRLAKSNSEEQISWDDNRATADKKSKSIPSNMMGSGLRMSGVIPRSANLQETSEPSNWERAEAVKRTASRPAINVAQTTTTTQAILSNTPTPIVNHAVLAGGTRLSPSPSAPITSPSLHSEKITKITRSASVQLSSPPKEIEEHHAYYEIALTVASVLCEQYPAFASEWRNHTNTQRETTIEKIVSQLVSRRFSPTSPTSSSIPSPLSPSSSSSSFHSHSSSNSPHSHSPPSSSVSLPPSPTFLSSPITVISPLSLSSGSVPPPTLSQKRNTPDKYGSKKEKEKDKDKDKEKDKDKTKKDKKDKLKLLRTNSGKNFMDHISLHKSASAPVHDETLSHLHEFTRSVTSDWISSEMKKRSRSLTVSKKKLKSLNIKEDKERESDTQVTGKNLGEFATGLETSLTEFLSLVNSSILSHEKTNMGFRTSSISTASIESLGTSINGMRDNLKEVLEVQLKNLDEAINNIDGSDRKIHKKKDKSPVPVLELLHRAATYSISLLDNIPLKGKSNDAMVSALAAVTVNFINTKLKMEGTLEENIYSESANLRGCVVQVVLEIRASAINTEEMSSQSTIFQLICACNLFAETLQKILDTIATLRYVMTSECTFSGSIKISNEDYDDVNIWDDNTEILYSDGVFRAGNLNKLVETLTSTTQIDNKYLSTFITTYQSITTPAQFFAKLVQRYNAPNSIPIKDVKAIQVRVCIVLKYWIENQFRDFDTDMVSKLFDFIEKVLPSSGNGEVSKSLKHLLATRVNEVTAKRNAMLISPICTMGLKEYSPSLIFTFSPFEIAKQLTLIEYTLFSKIHPAEFLSQAWNSRTARQNSTHVLDLIQRTNRLSFWVGSLLLWQPSLQHRVKMLSKIIALGQELRNLNNFNTLMGIVAGLSMSAVNRLKNTFKGLETKQNETLEKLQTVLNPGMSFKCYRQELRVAKGPCLPYLGTILSDLTFMEDGNPNSIPCPKSKKMLVNYSKRELINNVLLEIQMRQQVPYNIPRMEPLTSFLEALPCAEDKELYELSLVREPREIKPIKQ